MNETAASLFAAIDRSVRGIEYAIQFGTYPVAVLFDLGAAYSCAERLAAASWGGGETTEWIIAISKASSEVLEAARQWPGERCVVELRAASKTLARLSEVAAKAKEEAICG